MSSAPPPPPARPGAARDAELVAAVQAGDAAAFGELYERWVDRVHDVVHRICWDPDVTADVVQDTFIRAWKGVARLDDPHAFGGWLLRIGRNVALNSRRGAGRVVLSEEPEVSARVEDAAPSWSDPHAAVADGEIAELLWDAAAALGERDAQVLDLHLRHGLAPAELAEELGMNRNAANQALHRMKQRLGAAVRARVLWRGGEPRCAELAAALSAAGVTRFEADAVPVINRHVTTCDDCDERQRLSVQPAAMFSAIPVLAAPMALRTRVAAALTDAGVPMDASEASADVTSPDAGAGADASSPGDGSDPSGWGDSGPGSADGVVASAAQGPATHETTGAPPVGGDAASDASARRGRRRMAVLVAAAVVLLAGVGAVAVLTAPGDGDGALLTAPDAAGAAGDEAAELAEQTTDEAAGDVVAPGDTTTTVDPNVAGEDTTATTAADQGAPQSTAPSVAEPSGDTSTTTRPTTSTTTAPTTSTTAPPTTTTAPTTTTTTAPTTTTTAPTSTTTTAPTGSLSISPRDIPAGQPVPPPTLTWTTADAGAVRVAGPGAGSTQLAGTQAVCPGSVVRDRCAVRAGTYTYVLEVFDTAGTLRLTVSAELTAA